MTDKLLAEESVNCTQLLKDSWEQVDRMIVSGRWLRWKYTIIVNVYTLQIDSYLDAMNTTQGSHKLGKIKFPDFSR